MRTITDTLAANLSAITTYVRSNVYPVVKRNAFKVLVPRELTYATLVDYIVTLRPDDPRIRRAAVMRQPVAGGIRVRLLYIDLDNNVCCDARQRPHGRSMVVMRFDEELDTLFGDGNLLLVR
jgi:hypothetical protein